MGREILQRESERKMKPEEGEALVAHRRACRKHLKSNLCSPLSFHFKMAGVWCLPRWEENSARGF